MANLLAGRKRKTTEDARVKLIALATEVFPPDELRNLLVESYDRCIKMKHDGHDHPYVTMCGLPVNLHDRHPGDWDRLPFEQFRHEIKTIRAIDAKALRGRDDTPITISTVLCHFMQCDRTADALKMCSIIADYAYRPFTDQFHTPTYIECRQCVDIGCLFAVPWGVCKEHGKYKGHGVLHGLDLHEKITARLAQGKILLAWGEEVPVPYHRLGGGAKVPIPAVQKDPVCFSEECAHCHGTFCMVHFGHTNKISGCAYDGGCIGCPACATVMCTKCDATHSRQCPGLLVQPEASCETEVCEFCGITFCMNHSGPNLERMGCKEAAGFLECANCDHYGCASCMCTHAKECTEKKENNCTSCATQFLACDTCTFVGCYMCIAYHAALSDHGFADPDTIERLEQTMFVSP